MNEIDRNLYIPQGLKIQKEIFEGFGRSEMIRASIICVISTMIDVFIYLITKSTMIFIVIILSSITASIMVTQKDRSNISVFDQVKYMIRFYNSQKYYKYNYLPEWGEKSER